MSSNNLEVDSYSSAAVVASTAATTPESGNGSTVELSLELKASAEFWREFNLDARRQELKRQCLEMIEAKTASSNGKKRLNEITKSFRTKSPVFIKLHIAISYDSLVDRLLLLMNVGSASGHCPGSCTGIPRGD
jgi:hypothetical protein